MTIKAKWKAMRTVTTDDTALDADTKGLEAMPAGAYRIESQQMNMMQIAVAATGDGAINDQTIPYKIYAGCDGKGPAELIAQGNWTVGAMAFHYDPSGGENLPVWVTGSVYSFWCDIVGITDEWHKDVDPNGDTAADGLAAASFDGIGRDWFFVEIGDAFSANITKVLVLGLYV